MSFKARVGPAQITIHQGQTLLVTEPDGQVNWPSKRGLYFRDTRVISAWAIYANSEPWEALCELQGYVYDAWLRMAEIYDELDNKRRAIVAFGAA
jgi:hypothetical protein